MTHRCMYIETSETLARHRHDKIIGGVCAGIARWLGWDAWVIRLSFVLTALIGAFFPTALLYVAMWALLPVQPCGHDRCRRENDLDEILGDDWRADARRARPGHSEWDRQSA